MISEISTCHLALASVFSWFTCTSLNFLCIVAMHTIILLVYHFQCVQSVNTLWYRLKDSNSIRDCNITYKQKLQTKEESRLREKSL